MGESWSPGGWWVLARQPDVRSDIIRSRDIFSLCDVCWLAASPMQLNYVHKKFDCSRKFSA